MVQIWHVPPRLICWVWSLVWQSREEEYLNEIGSWDSDLINGVILLWLPIWRAMGRCWQLSRWALIQRSGRWASPVSRPFLPVLLPGWEEAVFQRSSHSEQFTLLFPNMFCFILGSQTMELDNHAMKPKWVFLPVIWSISGISWQHNTNPIFSTSRQVGLRIH